MSYIAEFKIPPESFPFGQTLLEMQDIEIEIDQILPAGESALPFFWVHGCNPEEFMAAAEDEPDVEETRKLESVAHTALYRAEWKPDAKVINELITSEITLIRANGTADGWQFEVRMTDRAEFGRLWNVFQAANTKVDLIRIYDLSDQLKRKDESVTADQREALVAAYKDGYFEHPRETSLDELSEQFDISSRAVSERIRRGTRNLVRETLLSPEDA